MPAEFELYKDAAGRFRFRLQAGNNGDGEDCLAAPRARLSLLGAPPALAWLRLISG